MGATLKLDPRLLINPPFADCPACGERQFGVLTIHAHSFVRRCRACLNDQTYELPPVRKTLSVSGSVRHFWHHARRA